VLKDEQKKQRKGLEGEQVERSGGGRERMKEGKDW